MNKIESKNLEYKSEIPKKKNDLKAEIVSFLNTDGGTIFLGMDDDGNLIEENKKYYKEWEELLNNWIYDGFHPEVANLISLEVGDSFKIIVKKGRQKPYFYSNGEGFNAKGVYVRVGSSKRVASFDEIQRMIMSSKSSKYETISCNRDDLTFEYLEKRLKDNNIKLDLHGLSLINTNGEFINAALLLSDQNPTISKFAVFQGTGVSVFLDKKEFEGSIIKQLDDILYFSNLSNRKKIIITGKPRRDEYLDIPERALREAICNCYCHRDWSLSGDIKVEFYDDKVKVFSPGSIPNGLTLENIKEGMTAKRNDIIVKALDKADYIENYASGVRRIFEDYEDFNKKPNYYISDNGVIVTLYNRNYEGHNEPINEPINELINEPINNELSEREILILKEIEVSNRLTINEFANKMNVSRSTIKRDLKNLINQGLIEYKGSKKTGKWIIKNDYK